MKLFLLATFYCFVLASFAQADTLKKDTSKIYNAKNIKRGFYKTYEEFINNAPSEIREFTVIKLIQGRNHLKKSSSDSTVDSTEVAADFKLSKNEKRVGSIYGFSDGTSVYIRFDGIYWKLEKMGPIPFFVCAIKTGNIPLPTSLISMPIIIAGDIIRLPIAIPLLQRGSYRVMTIKNNGVFTYPDSKYVKKLLAPYQDLLLDFEEEWTPYARFDYANPDNEESDESFATKMDIVRKYLTLINERLTR